MDLSKLIFDEIFSIIILEVFSYLCFLCECGGLSDEDLIFYCCRRVLGDFKSGWDF